MGSGDVLVYCSALGRLDPTDLVDLYWAGRTTLVNARDDIARYDEVFRRRLAWLNPHKRDDPPSGRARWG